MYLEYIYVHWYAKAKNKYIKKYDENKDSLYR